MDMLGALAEMYGADEVGEDMMGEELGASRGRAPRWMARQERGAPGAPNVAEQMLPLQVSTIVFNLTAPLRQTALGQTQLAFRGERVTIERVNSGTTAPLRAVGLTDIKCGQRSQLPGVGGQLPISAFGPTAFGVRLALAPVAPGILFNMDFLCDVAPTTTDSITLLSCIFGRAVC